MTAIIDIGTLNVRTPETCGNRPRIGGTRVSVQRIVVWHKRGLTPEEIRNRFGHLNLAQIHAALAYYYANQDEICLLYTSPSPRDCKTSRMPSSA